MKQELSTYVVKNMIPHLREGAYLLLIVNKAEDEIISVSAFSMSLNDAVRAQGQGATYQYGTFAGGLLSHVKN